MKVQLQLKQTTQLTLTPQLQQSIRLLQLSTVELEQEVETFLRNNPLIERIEAHEAPDSGPLGEMVDTPHASEHAEDSAITMESWGFEDGESGGRSRDADEDESFPDLRVAHTSLSDHLFNQLRLLQLSERDLQLLMVMIDNLDEDGYLRQSFDQLATETDLTDAVDEREWSTALHLLQSLEPVGIGARNLAECLRLQIQDRSDLTLDERQSAEKLTQHLPILAQKDYARLKLMLGVGESTLRRLHQWLLQLDPRPGAAFMLAEAHYVVPDVLVRRKGRGWAVMLNPEVIPKLRINSLYSRCLEGTQGASLNPQLQEARWLIKNIGQRFDTILRVAQAVVERQRDFFELGEVAMKPLVLREIADTLGLHESTISRVTSQKYLLTPKGLFELKYFFSSHVGTDGGGAASSTAIRALVRQLIAREDVKHPLSDQRMADVLGEQGYQVARRTVAKYREAMHIQAASLRKSL